jgi:hypothetical protein
VSDNIVASNVAALSVFVFILWLTSMASTSARSWWGWRPFLTSMVGCRELHRDGVVPGVPCQLVAAIGFLGSNV